MIRQLIQRPYLLKSARSFSSLRQQTVALKSYFYEAVSDKVSKHLIFLHGLLGNGRNWRSIALSQQVSLRRNCIVVDQRNHGESDHSERMDYRVRGPLSQIMAQDVLRLADQKKLDKFTLLGHSMGGKVAMKLAQHAPQRLEGLIVVDSPPQDNWEESELVTGTIKIVQELSKIDIKSKTKRTAMAALDELFPNNRGLVNFLAQNIIYQDNGKNVQWICNMTAIAQNLREIMDFSIDHPYTGPLLLLNGEKSYKFEREVYLKQFPELKEEEVVMVEGAGHWVHADRPKTTIRQICVFLDKIDG